MDERIVNGLKSKFEKHRIVFWYDTKKEMRDEFSSAEMPTCKFFKIVMRDHLSF